MKKKQIESVTIKLDEVHQMMIKAGYDSKKLNKMYLMFNILTISEHKDSFKFAINSLLKLNEQEENYEICQYLKQITMY